MALSFVINSVAFAGLFASPISWELKIFLGAALSAINTSLLIMDFQVDALHERQTALLTHLFKVFEDKIINDNNGPTIDEAIQNLNKKINIDHTAGRRDLITVGIVLFSLAAPITTGWLISKYLLGSV
jgi:hypothetical protein